MVATGDILLLGGGILAALYLSKRSDQVATIAPADYYQQVQAVDIQRLSEFGSRIEQLKDIRSQILGYEKGQAQQQISYLQSQISQAQQAASEAQRFLASGSFALGRTAERAYQSAGADIRGAIAKLQQMGGQSLLQIPQLLRLAQGQQETARIKQAEQFITLAEQQQADIMAKYSELEQIV